MAAAPSTTASSPLSGEWTSVAHTVYYPRPVSGDLSHLTIRGHAVVGAMSDRARMQTYVAYRAREG